MYNYKELFHNHPIWNKFKNKKIHIDHYFSVDYGAGGNFLLTQLYPSSAQNHYFASKNRNEFITNLASMSVRYNNADRLLASRFIADGGMYEQHLDLVMPLVEDWYNKANHCINIVRTHDAPYILLNALDLEIDILTHVSLDQNISWFTRSLDIIKNKHSKIRSEQFHKIDEIFRSYYKTTVRHLKSTKNIEDMNFQHGIFSKIAYEIHDSFSDLLDLASPIVYMYYIESLHQKQPASVEKFVEFYSSMVYGLFNKNPRIDLCNRVYNQISGSLSRTTDIQSVLYQDLFFDLNVPQTGIWRNCDPLEISRYSHKNIELVHSMSKITSPEVSDMIKNNLEKLSMRLQVADAKLSN